MRLLLILVVDVSKGYGDFVFMDSEKNVLEDCFCFDDNVEGYNIFK